jgi:cell division protease FtsH
MPEAPRSVFARPFTLFALLLVGMTLARGFVDRQNAPREVPYTELVRAIDDGKVAEAEVRAERIVVTLKAAEGEKAESLAAERLPNIDESRLVDRLREHDVVVRGKAETAPWWTVLLWFLPMLLFLPLLFGPLLAGAISRHRPMSFGKSKAKLYDRSRDQPVTFADVAGVDEAKQELAEIVSFLKEPGRYREIGARIPKGVLLVGGPGTGKTLLARAVAGEAGVPFFSMSGSEFVEMFVGVGASRVRDLFEQAKGRAPCIIFVDELDAVGKARSGSTGYASNEEREQTLNQLLVEMDGFDSGSGLIIMAATNRPEILDKALLRAGRFDRQVVVDRPDVKGREAILAVHAKKIRLGVSVELRVLAQRTPGMVGADLANVVNEAALASVRRGSKTVEMEDFEEAIDRIQLGLKKEARVMTEVERKRVAIHESGHALVALSVDNADPVHRVTIIPRSIGALGATLQLPTEERYLMTRDELLDRMAVLLGGRVAEEIACQGVSTGAQDDLERATELARQMVLRFGMSERIGPVAYGRQGGRFLAAQELGIEPRSYSEETAQVIDAEVRRLVDGARASARAILERRRLALDTMAKALLARETLERKDLESIAANESAMSDAEANVTAP